MLGMDSPGLDGSKPNIQAVILSSRTLNFVCCLATMHTFWMNCFCSWLEHGTWSAKHKSPTLPSLSLEVTLKKCFIWSTKSDHQFSLYMTKCLGYFGQWLYNCMIQMFQNWKFTHPTQFWIPDYSLHVKFRLSITIRVLRLTISDIVLIELIWH